MINPDFVRLALAGSKAAWVRLCGMVAGVALGTALLLLLIGAFNGLGSRDDRMAWGNVTGTVADAGSLPDAGHVLVNKVADWFDGRPITRIDVAAAPDSTVEFPGMAEPLAAGHFRASPALLALIAATAPDQLAMRYGIADGEIAPSALTGPDTLALIQAVTPEEMAGRRRVLLTDSLAGKPRAEGAGYQIIVAIGAIGILFPVLLLIAIVTQLGAATRRETFSTLRLIGATPRQLALVTGVENLLVSIAGALLGTALTFVLMPIAALFPVNGSRFYLHDLAVTPATVVIAVGAMAAVSAVATLVGMGRGRIGPLGASRQILEKRPRAWRLIPLAVGLAMMGSALASTMMPLLPGVLVGLVLIGGFVVISAGIVIAGPWLTRQASRFLTHFAGSASAVIAGNRIASLPKATFRAVSGLIIAVFMVTVFCAASSGAMREVAGFDGPDRMPGDALYMAVKPGAKPTIAGVVLYHGGALPQGIWAARAQDAAELGLSPVGAAGMISFSLNAYLEPGLALPISSAARDDLAPEMLTAGALVRRTDGQTASIERARTAMQTSGLGASAPVTRMDAAMIGTQRLIKELAMIAYAGALVSIAIAGCSLAIATASAMIDRKRAMGLLRLMGMPVNQLYRVVIFEAAVPLVAVLGVSVGLGFLVAWLIVESVSPTLYVALPEPLYFVTLALGLLLALGAVAATLRMVRANTALSATRFE